MGPLVRTNRHGSWRASRSHQPARSRAPRVGDRRVVTSDPRVLERRQEAADDARRKERGRQRSHPFRKAAGRRVPPRWARAGRRRTDEHARRGVRCPGQIPDRVRHQGNRPRPVHDRARGDGRTRRHGLRRGPRWPSGPAVPGSAGREFQVRVDRRLEGVRAAARRLHERDRYLGVRPREAQGHQVRSGRETALHLALARGRA